MKKALILLTTLAFSVAVAAAANTYHITLTQPSIVNGNQLKAGSYKILVEGNQATFKMGKATLQAPVKVEEADHKTPSDEIIYEGQTVQEIRIGGSNTRLVFGGAPAQSSGTR